MLKGSLSRSSQPAWVAFGIGLLATAATCYSVVQDIEDDAARQFAAACDQVVLNIRERLGAYSLVLRGAAALVTESPELSRQQWRTYVETLQADGSVFGVQGIGLARLVRADQLAGHVARVRGEGFPDYTVRPSGARPVYAPIVYLEPFRDRNLRAFGYDMYSEPVRRAAMERARDTEYATLSGKVELVQETGAEVQAGTLMYVPVYRKEMARDTVEQRREALIGWAYSPYRMKDLMAGILRDWKPFEGGIFDLSIYDGFERGPATLLYRGGQPERRVDATLSQQRVIEFNGRTWLLVFDGLAGQPGISYVQAWAALGGGLLLSGLLFGLVLSMVTTRERAARIAGELTEEIRNREALLKESEYRWKFAIEGSGDGLWDWNVVDGTVFFSPRWKQMLGFTEEEIGNGLDEWEKRLHPDDKEATLASVQACLEGKLPIYTSEHRVRAKHGNYLWVLDRGIVVSRDETGKPLRMIGTHSDITARKAAEESVTHLAHYDALTDLPNRLLLADRLHQALARARRDDEMLAVLFLDLDKFKPVNDTLGHDVGDLLLKEVALRLRACLQRESDTVSRLGGDEFVILLTQIENAQNAVTVAEKVLQALGQAFRIGAHVIHISSSVGIALFPRHGESVAVLLKNADAAMYDAKRDGRNCYRIFAGQGDA